MNKKAFALTTLIMLLMIAYVVGLFLTKWLIFATLAVLLCGLLMFVWIELYEEIERELRHNEWRKK